MAKYEFKKKKGNLKFYLILFLIAGGYLFFFSSLTWMPAGTNSEMLTPLGEEQEWAERTIEIVRWDYSESQELMEIEMDIKNNTFDGVNCYTYSAIDRAGDTLTVQKIIEEPDWVVVQIKGVTSSFGEVSFRIDIPEKKEIDTLRLYTNKNSVRGVNKLEIKDRNGYRKGRFELQIAEYKKEIQQKEKQMNTIVSQNEQMQLEIERLQNESQYQTEEQKEETNARITEITGKMTSNQEETENLQKDIEECRKRIALAEKQIVELGN